jgi:hypothetical protein
MPPLTYIHASETARTTAGGGVLTAHGGGVLTAGGRGVGGGKITPPYSL